MRVVSRMLAAALLVMVTGSSARAADQPILGSQLLLKNPGPAEKRKLIGKAKEKASPNSIVGNPMANGGTVTITANGGTPGSQTFTLPTGTSPITGKPFWSGDVTKGFKYKDPKLENSAIKGVTIKKTGGGVFSILVMGDGKNIPGSPITVLPPNPGVSGCILLTITGGDSYSVKFGPLDGTITNKGAAQYKQKKPTGEGTCVTTTTTTTTSTTSTTIPACSPNCPVGNSCLTNSNCTTNFCSGGVCKCPAQNFSRSMSTVVVATLQNWPGGSQGFGTGTCGGVLLNPSGNISNLSGDTWAVSSLNGFSSCGLTSNTPNCQTVGAVANILGNGRPYCSNSSDAFSGGPSTASVGISCNP